MQLLGHLRGAGTTSAAGAPTVTNHQSTRVQDQVPIDAARLRLCQFSGKVRLRVLARIRLNNRSCISLHGSTRVASSWASAAPTYSAPSCSLAFLIARNGRAFLGNSDFVTQARNRDKRDSAVESCVVQFRAVAFLSQEYRWTRPDITGIDVLL